MRERGSKKYNTLELTEGRRNRKTNEAMDESFCHSRNGNDIIVVGMECVNGGWQKGERKREKKLILSRDYHCYDRHLIRRMRGVQKP